MPWHAVPGSLERDRQRRRVRIRAARLAVGDLDGALAGLPAPHAEGGVLLVGRDDVDRLGARIARAAGWVVEDRDGVRRARVLDPHGVLRVGGVGLVHDQQPAERIGSPVGVEHGTGAGGRRCCRGSGRRPSRTMRHAARAEQLQRRRAGRRHDLDRVVEARRRRARGRGQPGRAVPASRPPAPARASIERRVSSARDASLQRSSSCARIESELTAAPEGEYPHGR